MLNEDCGTPTLNEDLREVEKDVLLMIRRNSCILFSELGTGLKPESRNTLRAYNLHLKAFLHLCTNSVALLHCNQIGCEMASYEGMSSEEDALCASQPGDDINTSRLQVVEKSSRFNARKIDLMQKIGLVDYRLDACEGGLFEPFTPPSPVGHTPLASEVALSTSESTMRFQRKPLNSGPLTNTSIFSALSTNANPDARDGFDFTHE
jgi:hypothetical protein